MRDSLRVNELITAPEIRLIGADGEPVGVVTAEEARGIAVRAGMDLVEIAPNARPPVCRVMDYGKYQYAQAKRAREAKKKQKRVHLKEIKVRPTVDPHDYQTKVAHIAKFLKAGDKVKVMMMFRGREVTHSEIGRRVLDRIVADIKGLGTLDRPPILEGKAMTLVLLPLHQSQGAAPAETPAAPVVS